MKLSNSLDALCSGRTNNIFIAAGLVETICDHLKHIHMKLNMDALEMGKPPTGRKKVQII
jgi:hypothetical protein